MASSYPEYGAPPPAQYPYPPSTTTYNNSTVNSFTKTPSDMRGMSRTPSPTPSEEQELLRDGLLDWRAMTKVKFWIRREWLWYYIIGAVIGVVTILVSVFHTQIVHALTPVTNWMHNLKFGWLIPIGVLFVISFPPLFGQEIVHILCGLVWGLWVGFAIVAAGTLIGEIGNFYAFKYCCRARGEKMEQTNLTYGCLAKVVRDGGFKIALIARLSAMPGHFTTAIFSTCGMHIITFIIAAILSLPKQFITVYIGVILEESGTGTESKKDKLISDSVLAVTILITVAAMWYLMRKMRLAKPDVIYARRKARQAKMERADFTPYGAPNDSNNSVVFNPQGSDTNIPLNTSTDLPYGASVPHQQWDKHGRAVGYSSDPRLHAPEPKHARVPTYEQYGTGTTYPHNDLDPSGRSPVRQQSDEVAWDTQHNDRDTFELPRVNQSPPRVSSPPGIRVSSPNNPFTPAAQAARQATYPKPLSPPPSNAFAAPSGPPPHFAQTPTQAQYANFSQPPAASAGSMQSPPLPNPFPGSPPAHQQQGQFFGHAPEPTDATFYTADGHSRMGTENAPQDPSLR